MHDYHQDEHGVPHYGVKMMKASIKTNAPAFNTHRMIADYVTQVYAPGSAIEVDRSLASVPS